MPTSGFSRAARAIRPTSSRTSSTSCALRCPDSISTRWSTAGSGSRAVSDALCKRARPPTRGRPFLLRRCRRASLLRNLLQAACSISGSLQPPTISRTRSIGPAPPVTTSSSTESRTARRWRFATCSFVRMMRVESSSIRWRHPASHFSRTFPSSPTRCSTAWPTFALPTPLARRAFPPTRGPRFPK